MEDGAINWGDGLVEKYGVVAYDTSVSANSDKWITHTYETAGTYTIKAKSILSCRKYYSGGLSPHSTIQETLTKVIQVPRTIVQSEITTNDKYCIMSAFSGCYMLTYADLTNLNENIAYFNNLFYGCQQLKELKFGNVFVTTLAVNLTSTFNGCYSLKIDMENLPVFPYCQNAALGSAFYRCGYSTIVEEDEEVHLDLRIMFPHQKETFSIGSMGFNFNGCGATKITLPDRVKITGLSDARNTFSNAPYLKYIDMNGMQYHLQDMRSTFGNCPSLETIDFTGCTFILGNFLGNAFANCPKLKNFIVGEGEFIDFTDIVSSYVTLTGIFEGCSSVEDLSMFKFKASSPLSRTFTNCKSLTKLPTFVDDDGNETKVLKNSQESAGNSVFSGCSSLTDLSEYTFYYFSQYFFNGCSNLIHVGRLLEGKSTWANLFADCPKLTTIDEFEFHDGGGYVDGTIPSGHNTQKIFYNCKLLANVNFTGTSQCAFADQSYWEHPPFTRESLLSFFNMLGTAHGVPNSGVTLSHHTTITINRNSYNLLSSSDIAIATDKGWTIKQATS